MRRTLLIFGMFAALAVGLLAVNGTARAQTPEPTLTLTAPARAVLGEPMTLVATLHDAAGQPLAGVPVSFQLRTEFLGKFGNVELGTALTDATGTATFLYEPRQSGDVAWRAVTDVPGAGALTLDLAAQVVGDRQLVVTELGTSAPDFEHWALVAVLATVWLIIFSVALRLHGINRDTSATPPDVPYHFARREPWS